MNAGWLRGRHTARSAAAADLAERNDRVAGIDQVVYLESRLVQAFVQAFDKRPDPVVTAIRAGQESGGVDLPLDLRIKRLPQRLTGALDVVEHPPHKLRVLRRHRPASIPSI